MSEKMYEAIYKVAKTSESDNIVLWMDKVEIKGTLLDCEDNKCIKDIITLQDAIVKCMKHHDEEAKERHFKWLNISACHIKAFTFKCCMED